MRNDSHRKPKRLIIYGRLGRGAAFRWMTTISPDALILNSRDTEDDYSITRLKVAPERETDALKRHQGRYRRQRAQARQEIQQQAPHGKPPKWQELRYKVKELRQKTNNDSEQEDDKRHATIRKTKYTAYGKRQEARRREQKP